jgi:hypothetical protein
MDSQYRKLKSVFHLKKELRIANISKRNRQRGHGIPCDSSVNWAPSGACDTGQLAFLSILEVSWGFFSCAKHTGFFWWCPTFRSAVCVSFGTCSYCWTPFANFHHLVISTECSRMNSQDNEEGCAVFCSEIESPGNCLSPPRKQWATKCTYDTIMPWPRLVIA